MQTPNMAIRIDKHTYDILNRASQIKRITKAELLRIFADLFSCGMELIRDDSIDIETLRQYYQHFELSVCADPTKLRKGGK